MKMVVKVFTVFLFYAALFMINTGCQDVFITSPFSSLMQPEASEIPPDQLSEYCWDIMANGTPEEQAAALTATQAAIAAGSTDPQLNYVAGILALDQAGLSMDTFLDDSEDTEDLGVLLIENTDLIQEVAGYLITADNGGMELTAIDMFIAGVGSALEVVDTIDDIIAIDFENPPEDLETSVNYINASVNSIIEAFPEYGASTSEFMYLL